jgi:ribonuclease P protein component
MATTSNAADSLSAVGEPAAALRRLNRLNRHADFTRVQRYGLRFQTPHFVVYGLRFSDTEEIRLGMAVSRRIGSAVIRNRIKRRLREHFRLTLRRTLPSGTAIVIVASTGAGTLKTPDIADEIARATENVQARLLS